MALTDFPKTIIDTTFKTAGGLAQTGRSQATALLKRAQNFRNGPKAGMTDATLKAKVETVIARTPGVTKGDVNITVVDGNVTLHGTAKNPAAVKALEAAISAVPEVKGTENLLALKGSTARKAPARPRKPRSTGGRVNREVKATTKAEPSPRKLAEAGKGRQPAPLGAKETPDLSKAATPGAKVDAALSSQKDSPAAAKTGTGATKA